MNSLVWVTQKHTKLLHDGGESVFPEYTTKCNLLVFDQNTTGVTSSADPSLYKAHHSIAAEQQKT